MSDFKLPDLPSDDELGITDEDREAYDDEPELTPEERKALGLDDPAPKPAPKAPPSSGGKKSSAGAGAPKDGAAAGPGTPPPGKTPPPGGEPPKKKKAKAPRPPEPSGPRSRWRGPVTLLVLLVAGFLSSSYRTLPTPVPANAPDTAFSSARAMALDVEIAQGPHPTGSPANARVRDYILGRLRDLGLEPQVQTSTTAIGRGSRVRVATVRNIVARIPGTQSTGAILLLSHYDAAEIAHGAADDGAGVVSTLETVRALTAGAPLKNDVIVLITDGEELGLMGAKAFVEGDPLIDDVSLVLNVEMRGGGGPSLMFETSAENGWIIDAMRHAGIPAWASSVSYEVYKRMPNGTDFTEFRDAGKQGLNFAAVGRPSVYHQTYDTPANLSEATLQHHGENLLGMTRYLGGVDLGRVTAPDVTYFTLPFVGVVAYPNSLVLPLTAWMLLLSVLVLIPVLRGPGRWPGLVAGLVVGAGTAALTGAAGWGLLRWLPRFHPEYGALVGSVFHHEGWYVLTLVGVSLFGMTTLFGVARRWFRAPTLAWGALLIPVAGAVYLTLQMPAAAAVLQWPVMAADVGLAALLLAAGRRTSMIAWIIALVLALPVMALMEPLTELFWLGMTFRAALVIGVLITIGLILLLPALEWLREPNGWWAPLLSLVFAGAMLGLGIRAAAPSPERPAPSTLAWSYDHGTGEALWVTSAPDSARAYEPAQAWAAARAGASFTETRDLAAFGYRPEERQVVTATNAVTVPPLEAWVLSDSMEASTRHLRLALRSAMGAALLQFRFPAEGATRLMAVNGQPLPIEERPTLVEYWGQPDPAVVLDLELPEGAAVDMDVVEHSFHPGDLVGAEHFQRPPDLAANVNQESDRAIVRTPAAALNLQYGPPPFSLERTDTEPGSIMTPAMEGLAADSMQADTAAAPTADSMAARPDTMPATPAPDTSEIRR